jgi:probable rRNA maturation factor
VTVTAVVELELEGAREAGIDESSLRRVVDETLADLGVDGPCALGVQIVGEREIRSLNGEHRGRDAVTDVLSFPIDALDPLPAGVQRQLGDVVICAAQVERQAAEAQVDPALELTTMLVHGLLHLVGHDHEEDDGEMLARQDRLLERVTTIGWMP